MPSVAAVARVPRWAVAAEGDFLRRPADTHDYPSTRPTGLVDEFVPRFRKRGG